MQRIIEKGANCMCGFVGYINKKNKDKQVIQDMSNKIIHRWHSSYGF